MLSSASLPAVSYCWLPFTANRNTTRDLILGTASHTTEMLLKQQMMFCSVLEGCMVSETCNSVMFSCDIPHSVSFRSTMIISARGVSSTIYSSEVIRREVKMSSPLTAALHSSDLMIEMLWQSVSPSVPSVKVSFSPTTGTKFMPATAYGK